MKKTFYLYIFLLLPAIMLGQSQNQNYVKTRTYVKPTTQGNITANDTIISIDYYDGLGRPIQNVAFKAGGTGQNITTPIVYDAGGKQTKNYLPFGTIVKTIPGQNFAETGGLISEINNFYLNKFPEDISASAPNPYSETFYDGSPLNRVVKQAAPGQDWKGSTNGTADHTIKKSYGTNKQNEVYRFRVTFPTGKTDEPALAVNGFYEPWELYKTITRDENWVPSDVNNRTTQEFKDKEGRVVLTRAFNDGQPHDTYYVYDKFSNLTYVIPPLAATDLVAGDPPKVYGGKNFAWTKLVEVDYLLAQEYDKELETYDNSAILNLDLLDKYEGQGGFSILPNLDKGINVSLNFTVTRSMPLRKGPIADLKDFGEFADMELGIIEGPNYRYYFTIKNNNLFVDGEGKVPSQTITLSGEHKLEYSKNYPWTILCDIDAQAALDYEDKIKNEDNALILSTYYENDYSAKGGISASVDQDNALTFSINIATDKDKKLSFKNGMIFPLDIQRRLNNRVLGDIVGDGYSYTVSLRDNTIYVVGTGEFEHINFHGVFDEQVPDLDINTASLQGLCYIYHYDKRNRVIEKKVPGKSWEYMVYDKLNRLIMMQDEKMKTPAEGNKWLFTKYDKFNRPVYTGFVTNANTRAYIQNEVNTQTSPVWHEERIATMASMGGVGIYYTGNTYPKTTAFTPTLNSINYFDTYEPAVFADIPTTPVYSVLLTTNVKTLPTSSRVRALDSADPNKWSLSFTAYDEKTRPIYAVVSDNYLLYKQTVHSKLDFVGKVIETTTIHNKNTATAAAPVWLSFFFYDDYYYDHMGRMLKHTQKKSDRPDTELISSNIYDALGRLEKKSVGGAENAPEALQVVDYKYNIRGWLRNINDIDAPLDNDLFAYRISYNTPRVANTTGAVPLYNGNISETYWKTASDAKLRGYGYKFDALNRLTDANYDKLNNLPGSSPAVLENYSEGGISYDKNGNIMRLKRYGYKPLPVPTIDVIDDLVYVCEPHSNKLQKVIDTGSGTSFKDGSNSGDDYTYDVNGNMEIDLNKGIGTEITKGIKYNYLNLPEEVTLVNGSIKYIYNTAGAKIKKIINKGGNIIITEYVGGFVYERLGTGASALQFFPTEEGYATLITSGPLSGNFSYVYQYKDHLGNVRLSYADADKNGVVAANEIIEENNYYAFGLKHTGYTTVNPGGNSTAQKWKYNNRELEENTGWYEMDIRHYDPTIARWMVIDPVIHYSMSTYNAFDNNPVYYADPSGGNAIVGRNGIGFTGADAGAAYNAYLNMIDTGEGIFTLQGEIIDPYGDKEEYNSLAGGGSGAIFNTELEAVLGFGLNFNMKSINANKEYGTLIYSMIKDGKKKFGHLSPTIGVNSAVYDDSASADYNPQLAAMKGETVEAIVHTHSAGTINGIAQPQWDGFSEEDRSYARNAQYREGKHVPNMFNRPIRSYVITPWGNVFFYDPSQTYGKSQQTYRLPNGNLGWSWQIPVNPNNPMPSDPALKN